MKTTYLFIITLLVLLVTGCQKEEVTLQQPSALEQKLMELKKHYKIDYVKVDQIPDSCVKMSDKDLEKRVTGLSRNSEFDFIMDGWYRDFYLETRAICRTWENEIIFSLNFYLNVDYSTSNYPYYWVQARGHYRLENAAAGRPNIYVNQYQGGNSIEIVGFDSLHDRMEFVIPEHPLEYYVVDEGQDDTFFVRHYVRFMGSFIFHPKYYDQIHEGRVHMETIRYEQYP